MRLSLYRHRRVRQGGGGGKPHKGGLPALTNLFNGVAVKNASDITAHNFNNEVLTWDSEIYDADAAHSTSSNTDRITIPSAWNGKYGILHLFVLGSNVANASMCALELHKAGVTTFVNFAGFTGEGNSNAGAFYAECMSGPLLLTTGDQFTVLFGSTDTSITMVAASTVFSMEIIG